jgi:hypothetical protein
MKPEAKLRMRKTSYRRFHHLDYWRIERGFQIGQKFLALLELELNVKQFSIFSTLTSI